MSNCNICHQPKPDCICPECPTCGQQGKVKCYTHHVLVLTKPQLIARLEYVIDNKKQELDDMWAELDILQRKPDDYCKAYPGVGSFK